MRRLLLALALISLAVPASAHHSSANYDTGKEIVLKGVVTAWLFGNPHCVLRFDTRDDTRTVRNWAAEVQNPTEMTRLGWSRRSFAAGDAVTVTLKPGRGGAPIGLIVKVLLPNGQTLYANGQPTGGKPSPPPRP